MASILLPDSQPLQLKPSLLLTPNGSKSNPRISLPSFTASWQTSSFVFSPPSSQPAPTTPPKPSMSLRDYVREAWQVVEPATHFVPGWHIDCISEHLEAVSSGELLNLIINIPPRHMKSLLVSVFWPTWEWTYAPALRWLFASYAIALSIRDTLKSRRVIRSPWYQERWGDVFHLAGDQNTKSRYENDRTGFRIATSPGGIGTGEGGHRLVADDPHNVKKAESDAVREDVVTWWRETMSTRGNDPKHTARVIVMQRLHRKDVVGEMLDMGGYHHLCLPAEYEPRVTVDMATAAHTDAPQIQPHDDCPIAADPRTDEGELLWPELNDAEVLAQLKLMLGPYAIAGQLQQRPTAREGALFKVANIRPLPADFDEPREDGKTLRQRLRVVQVWDLAYSEKESADYTASCTLGIDRSENLYLLHMWRKRVQELELGALDDDHGLCAAMANHIVATRPQLVGIWGGAFRKRAIEDLIRRLLQKLAKLGYPVGVMPIPEDTDKYLRAQLPAGRADAGLLYADRTAPWWPALQTELVEFPRGEHDDQVDALSGAATLAIATANQQQRPQHVRHGG